MECQLDLPVIGGLYKLVIKRDENPDNPREWDNIGRFCVPSRCKYVENEADIASDLDWESAEEDKKVLEKQGYIAFPVMVYDHSGVHVYVGEPENDWDRRQIGWYIAKKGEATKEQLVAEVALYNQYINGEVYKFEVYHGEDGLIDSCGGFYSIEEIRGYLQDEIPNLNPNLELEEGENLIDTRC